MGTGNSSKMATLLSRLRKETNGAVVEAMTARGIHYPLSYGVAVPAIREASAGYAPDHALSKLLYRQEVRELRLAGIFIADPAAVTTDELAFWAEGVINTEVGEHLAHALLGRSPVAERVLSRWLSNEQTPTVRESATPGSIGAEVAVLKIEGTECCCPVETNGEGRADNPKASGTKPDTPALLSYTALLTGARALSLGDGKEWDYDLIFSSLPAALENRVLWPAAAAVLDRVIGKVPGGKERVAGLLKRLERSEVAAYAYLHEELGWQLE